MALRPETVPDAVQALQFEGAKLLGRASTTIHHLCQGGSYIVPGRLRARSKFGRDASIRKSCGPEFECLCTAYGDPFVLAHALIGSPLPPTALAALSTV